MIGLPLDSSSLLGRRVEIHGLTSQKGRELNGQLGGVIKQLEAGRWCVRLERGDKSIRESNLRVRQLGKSEMAEMVDRAEERLPALQHRTRWPAEVVAFLKIHCEEKYNGPDPEEVAMRIDVDAEQLLERGSVAHTSFSPYLIVQEIFLGPNDYPEDEEFSTLLRYGFPLDGMLKCALRRVAGIKPECLHDLGFGMSGRICDGSQALIDLLNAAKITDREVDLLSTFDSTDLLRAVIAAASCVSSLRPHQLAITALRQLAATIFSCGISVRAFVDDAKKKFQEIYSDLPELVQESFHARIEKWCNWEQKQWRLIMRTFGQQGLGLPGAAATVIADCIVGWQPVASQVNQEQSFHVLQDVDHSEPVPQIDEEVAHTAVQVEVNEAWAQQVERHILKGERANEDSDGQDGEVWMETETSDASSALEAWRDGGKDRPSDFGERVHILGFTRSGAALTRALQEGRELEEVRRAAKDHDQSCLLKSGASIFLYPDQYGPVLSVIKQNSLKPHHVVVSEAFLPLVYQEIAKLPSRANVKPNLLKTTALIDGDNSECICSIERTFLNGAPHQHRHLDSLTQSTSQAHGIANVRGRVAPP